MKDNSLAFFLTSETHEETIFLQEQKVKRAIWRYLDFHHWTMGIETPSEAIDLLKSSIDKHYCDFPTINEYFKRRKHNVVKNRIEQMKEDYDQRLKFAIQEHMGFLVGYLEVYGFEIITTMDNLVNKFIHGYYTMEYRFKIDE